MANNPEVDMRLVARVSGMDEVNRRLSLLKQAFDDVEKAILNLRVSVVVK